MKSAGTPRRVCRKFRQPGGLASRSWRSRQNDVITARLNQRAEAPRRGAGIPGEKPHSLTYPQSSSRSLCPLPLCVYIPPLASFPSLISLHRGEPMTRWVSTSSRNCPMESTPRAGQRASWCVMEASPSTHAHTHIHSHTYRISLSLSLSLSLLNFHFYQTWTALKYYSVLQRQQTYDYIQ